MAAGRPTAPGRPLNTPLVPASNFVLGAQHEYARDDGTPTWEALEAIVGGLDGGHAVAFASGMGAIAAVFDQLPAGAHVAIPDDCYQGVAGLTEAGRKRGRWSVERVGVADTDGWREACGRSDLVWLESPSNPLLVVADIETVCGAPRKEGSILAVDNTFATPLNQRPLALGADVSILSATKHLGGHSDLLTGVATARTEAMADALRHSRELTGATPGTLEAFLAVRGARTMALRLERSQETALELARRLDGHASVGLVRYPGLPAHPGHDLARRQMATGFGTVISFDVVGDAKVADAVCERVELIQHATSLGAVESTMERRAAIPGQDHLPPSMLRLSVGIEALEDLWQDLDRALRAATER